MKILGIISLLLLSANASAAPEFFKTPDLLNGEIVSPASAEKLYQYKRTVKLDNDLRVAKREFTSLDGKPAVIETCYYKDGRVVRMTLEQLQTEETGEFEIRDNKIHFTWTSGGKTKTDSETLKEPLVSSDEVVSFIYKNWENLIKGESVSFRLPVIFRRETVGWKLMKESETTEALIFKMKPTSMVIAAIVKPLYFHIKKEGDHRVLLVDGRVAPKQFVEGKWKDLDAHLVMKY